MDILPSNAPQGKLCYQCGERPRMGTRWPSPYCRECNNSRKKGYNKKNYNPEQQRNRHLRTKFNLTQYDYDLMFFQQAGVCAVCGEAETKIHPVTGKVWPLRVDHNHETGQVRELLCNKCNMILGYLEGDAERIKKLKKYLKKHE